ncbi:MAG: glycosyltransferase family 2 protein [Janthinobacterium lividum]
MTQTGDDVLPEKLPLVSVSMTSYNSAAWIARAVESVLQQQASFPFELVIGDDCSSDNTPDLIRSLQQKHPDIIRVVHRTGKLGMQRNYYDTFQHCRGKYIAWLDADDYWTDAEKLSVQVAVLEADSTVSACGHIVRQVSPGGEVIRDRCPTMPAGRYRLEDMIAKNFIPSPSILFRNGIHRALPDSFFQLSGLVDWPILLQSALAGDIVLLDRVMADYVLTPGSAYQGKGPLYQDAIDLEFYAEMEQTLPEQWQRCIRAAEGKRYEAIAYHLAKLGNVPQAREAAWQAFRLPYFSDNAFSKCKVLLQAEVFGRIRKTRASDSMDEARSDKELPQLSR